MTTWIGFTWTNTGNYPGSATPQAPWLGQPLAVAPGVSYLIPNTKIPAETFNYCIGALATQDSYLYSLAANGAISNVLVGIYTYSETAQLPTTPNAQYFAANGWASNTSFVTGSAQQITLTGHPLTVQSGDVVEVTFATTAFIGGAATAQNYEMQLAMQAVCNGQTIQFVPGAMANAAVYGAYSQGYIPTTLTGIYVVDSAHAGTLVLYLNGACQAGAAPTTACIAYGYWMIVKVWRPVSL